MTTIHDLLHSLGVTGKYNGYSMAVKACDLIMEDESRLLKVTKSLYPEVAKQCGVGKITVERNIRTIIYKAWDTNRAKLCEIARFELTTPPTATEFLDMLVSHFRKIQQEEKEDLMKVTKQ